MTDMPASAVTRILADLRGGSPRAAEELLPIVYEQLRALARQNMHQERAGHTLQATALVHEAFLRLLGDADVAWDSRGHFYVAAAEAMRRILIEHARARGREKRGGGRQRVPLTVVDVPATAENPEHLLAVDDALRRLEAEDPDAANVVRLRFYAGLGVEETAQALGRSSRSVARDWAFARAWLMDELSDGAS